MRLELFRFEKVYVQISFDLRQHKLSSCVDQGDVLMKKRRLVADAKQLVDDLKNTLQRVQHLMTDTESEIGDRVLLSLQLGKLCHCCDVTADEDFALLLLVDEILNLNCDDLVVKTRKSCSYFACRNEVTFKERAQTCQL